jgi:outer membrane protein, heavy metal efflux system
MKRTRPVSHIERVGVRRTIYKTRLTPPVRFGTSILFVACVILGCVVSGCKAPLVYHNPNVVFREIFSRTSVSTQSTPPCTEVIPDGVNLSDGLTESEAVATGLANNSLFQTALAQLGIAGGDSVQASLIANPQVLLYFPSGAKEGQSTIYAPIESYFLRPTRVKVANREYRRIGDQLVQNGLNVARDIRLAYFDLALVTEQAKLSTEGLQLRSDIANLTQARFRDGEISELETIASRVDALNAKANEGVQAQNVSISHSRLASLLGIPTLEVTLQPEPLEQIDAPELDEQQLIETALVCRPDYHAARWAVAAAQERSKLSRWLFWRADGILDVRNGPGYTRSGTWLRFDLPIFNRNEGGILRADWERNAAMHNRDAIRDQIYQDVRVAYRQVHQAKNNLKVLENDVLPNLIDAIGIAKKGFEDGGTDYLLVLQTTTQYLDARARILDQRAALRRALAELERSVSRSLTANPLDLPGLDAATSPK